MSIENDERSLNCYHRALWQLRAIKTELQFMTHRDLDDVKREADTLIAAIQTIVYGAETD